RRPPTLPRGAPSTRSSSSCTSCAISHPIGHGAARSKSSLGALSHARVRPRCAARDVEFARAERASAGRSVTALEAAQRSGRKQARLHGVRVDEELGPDGDRRTVGEAQGVVRGGFARAAARVAGGAESREGRSRAANRWKRGSEISHEGWSTNSEGRSVQAISRASFPYLKQAVHRHRKAQEEWDTRSIALVRADDLRTGEAGRCMGAESCASLSLVPRAGG